MRKNALARDLMQHPVRQLTTWTTVRDAAAFLLRHGISGAPVIDDHGRWKGVFTQNDIARCVQSRFAVRRLQRSLESREAVEFPVEDLPEEIGKRKVGEVMTPGLYTVFPDATLEEVVHAMISFRVHRVFVIEERGTELLGVITTMDVLRGMEVAPPKKARA